MNFALTGVAGYIAPKHLEAIKEVGGNLIACLDPRDSVGILDRYFPNAEFFKDEAEFWKFIDKKVDYVSICSPNYQHFHQIQASIMCGAKPICEKPLVINANQIDLLMGDVNVILQLRLLFKDLKEKVTSGHKVEVKYVTPRGKWYSKSWKADFEKSGGLLMNIGVHLFDLLIWLFGDVTEIHKGMIDARLATGVFSFEKAKVEWTLSLDGEAGRKMIVDGVEYNFSSIDLHKESYKEIIEGRGFTQEDARKSIELINLIYGVE